MLKFGLKQFFLKPSATQAVCILTKFPLLKGGRNQEPMLSACSESNPLWLQSALGFFTAASAPSQHIFFLLSHFYPESPCLKVSVPLFILTTNWQCLALFINSSPQIQMYHNEIFKKWHINKKKYKDNTCSIELERETYSQDSDSY